MEITKTDHYKTRQKIPYAVAEFKVVEAIGNGANAPGTSAKNSICLQNDMANINIKNFLSSVLKVPASAPKTPFGTWSKTAEEMFQSGTNPAKGERVKCRTEATKTQAGRDFVVHRYSPYEVSK